MNRYAIGMLLGAACREALPVPTPSPPPPEPMPACDSPLEESLPFRNVAGAVYACDEAGCELALPEDEPTSLWSRVRAAGDVLVLDAGAGGLLVATPEAVAVVDVPVLRQFSVGADGRVWASSDDTVLAFGPGGQIVQRCERPESLQTVDGVVQVADSVIITGLTHDLDGALFIATSTGWAPLETQIHGTDVRPHVDDGVVVLGYGYAEAHDLAEGTRVVIGGSDDDFSDLAVCADGSYWLGGMTGILFRCNVEHSCEQVLLDDVVYPFQARSNGCGADNALWWLELGQETVMRTLSVGLESTSSPTPVGLRNQWARAGRTYRVVDAD